MAQPAERIRVLVADDEAPARQRLIDMLRKDPQIGGVLEAVNGRAAVEIIGREAPDLIFLDVQMPELDGLQVIETIGAGAMPLTVFVTAYDRSLDRTSSSAADLSRALVRSRPIIGRWRNRPPCGRLNLRQKDRSQPRSLYGSLMLVARLGG